MLLVLKITIVLFVGFVALLVTRINDDPTA